MNKIIEKKKKIRRKCRKRYNRDEEARRIAGLGLILLGSVASLLHTCNVFESVYRYSWFQRVVLDEPNDSLADVYFAIVVRFGHVWCDRSIVRIEILARRKSRFSRTTGFVGRSVTWIRKSGCIERERRHESRKLGHRFARFPFTIPFRACSSALLASRNINARLGGYRRRSTLLLTDRLQFMFWSVNIVN